MTEARFGGPSYVKQMHLLDEAPAQVAVRDAASSTEPPDHGEPTLHNFLAGDYATDVGRRRASFT
jgi:hypothetical protein